MKNRGDQDLPTCKKSILPLAITMGEPAGIGGDITVAAWIQRQKVPSGPFFILDDPERMVRLINQLGLAIPVVRITHPHDAPAVFNEGLPVLPLSRSVSALPAAPDKHDPELVLESINYAVSLVKDGSAAAVVTNPINKKLLYDAGFNFPGHTEYLAKLTKARVPPVMLLVGRDLRAALATIHMPLAEVPGALTRENLAQTIVTTARALRLDFTVLRPRIAIAGLNPHAGEEGVLGKDEIDLVRPAMELANRMLEASHHARLFEKRVQLIGPSPADTLFHRRARAKYDSVICLYHDQALIPVKTLDFYGSVNTTLGLPIIRTSPDHGTAFDLAGTGRARPESLMSALCLARTMSNQREKNSFLELP